jgi:hypothetical protein
MFLSTKSGARLRAITILVVAAFAIGAVSTASFAGAQTSQTAAKKKSKKCKKGYKKVKGKCKKQKKKTTQANPVLSVTLEDGDIFASGKVRVPVVFRTKTNLFGYRKIEFTITSSTGTAKELDTVKGNGTKSRYVSVVGFKGAAPLKISAKIDGAKSNEITVTN